MTKFYESITPIDPLRLITFGDREKMRERYSELLEESLRQSTLLQSGIWPRMNLPEPGFFNNLLKYYYDLLLALPTEKINEHHDLIVKIANLYLVNYYLEYDFKRLNHVIGFYEIALGFKKNPFLYVRIASILFSSARSDEAVQYLIKALKSDPENGAIRNLCEVQCRPYCDARAAKMPRKLKQHMKPLIEYLKKNNKAQIHRDSGDANV